MFSMNEVVRRKSPRAPSIALDEALDRALRAYDRERLHPAPTAVIAQHIGYKGANSGAALSALASLRYFGLLDRPKEGMLSVSKNVEAYKFSPDEAARRSILIGFLKSPPLYSDLLAKYDHTALPSEANLRYDLIQRGFAPTAAEGALAAFMRSVQYADYFGSKNEPRAERASSTDGEEFRSGDRSENEVPGSSAQTHPASLSPEENEFDRIPVRLSGGRRAWLIIPAPFYQADKVRLKAQIDLILTQDEEP
jgi:hypothetical protein